MRGLPPSMHGATFAHVTDIHAGFADLEKVYAEAVAQVNASEPDYIFFTGDYVDRRTDNPNYPIVELLQSFRARREVFGCLKRCRSETSSHCWTWRQFRPLKTCVTARWWRCSMRRGFA